MRPITVWFTRAAMRNLTLTITVRATLGQRFTYRLGLWCIRLGAWIAGIGVEERRQ